MTIRVLMVTDAEGSYIEQGERFGLTELVKALEEGGCEITKAHRWDNGMAHTAGADITSFKFTSQFFNPNEYDEVWLVGFASKNPNGPYGDPAGFELSNAEIETLAEFMNDGGGVFATGDHDDLGADLCGKVPRVRSMRRWDADYSWWQQYMADPSMDPDTIVPDFTKSPPPVGRYRLDTLVTGHNSHYEFADQSDDVPQEIDPVMHQIRSHITHLAGGHFGWYESLPHPLLCGSNGVIDVLPDHMHEGRCQVPSSLTTTFSLKGETEDEYPARSNGSRISPEVVAWATVKARAKDPNYDDPTETIRDSNTNISADYFPVITAYNGHRVDVGRVVVDATFHHFVNVNVTGVKSDFSDEPDATDAVKEQGFLASPDGMAHYEQIKDYWRNVAHWICRPKTIRFIAWDIFKELSLDPRLKQTTPMGNAETASMKHLVRYGASAWSLMTLTASPCKVFSFVIDIAIPDPLSYLLSYAAYIRLTLPDPPPDEVIRESLDIDRLELAYYALGAAMLELRQPQHRQMLLAGKVDVDRGMALVQRGALLGLRRGLKEQANRMERTLSALKQTIKLSESLSGGRTK